jgi:hypothetical protein
MKLKKVRLVLEYVVVAEDDESENIAREFACEACRDVGREDLDITISEYTPGSVQNWDGECIPYGGDGNTRTSEFA